LARTFGCGAGAKKIKFKKENEESMKNFRCYQMAKDLYKLVQTEPLKGESKDQIVRASLSICLNLIEGSARPTVKDRRRFFYMALSSLREVQAISDLHDLEITTTKADVLGAHIYKLIKAIQT
jgi:four helix bundle protein